MNKAERIEALYRQYKRDASFSHLREEGSRFVPGDGPLDAKVVVVGEAPGRNEDAEQRPFCGRSGALLDRMLTNYGGIRREDCYITNVVKYRPPQNRDPDPDEALAGKWYVGQEIVAVGAPIVVLVGRFAYQMVFGDEVRISEDHGVVRKHKGRWYLPVYHPATALYRRDMIDILRKDFSALARLVVEV